MSYKAPGGRDNAKMVPRSTFNDLMLPQFDGSYFLRPDRILGVFIFSKRMKLTQAQVSMNTMLFMSSPSSTPAKRTTKTELFKDTTDKRELVLEGCIGEARHDKDVSQTLDLFEWQSRLRATTMVEAANTVLPVTSDDGDDSDSDEMTGTRKRSSLSSSLSKMSESFLTKDDSFNLRKRESERDTFDDLTEMRYSHNPLFNRIRNSLVGSSDRDTSSQPHRPTPPSTTPKSPKRSSSKLAARRSLLLGQSHLPSQTTITEDIGVELAVSYSHPRNEEDNI